MPVSVRVEGQHNTRHNTTNQQSHPPLKKGNKMASFRLKNSFDWHDTFIHTDRKTWNKDEVRISSWNDALSTFVRGTATRQEAAEMIKEVRRQNIKIEKIR